MTSPARELADVVDAVGAESVLAAQILRQAVDDLNDLRAGKSFETDRRLVESPHHDLQAFFAGEWFSFLSAHLGQDPAAIRRLAGA